MCMIIINAIVLLVPTASAMIVIRKTGDGMLVIDKSEDMTKAIEMYLQDLCDIKHTIENIICW